MFFVCQSNGYKPAPLDLSAVTLTPKMDELVEQLAENTHNLWARERIQQGWTYGLNEVSERDNKLFCTPSYYMNELVEKLAENTHNLWARERIQQGWTYGLNEVSERDDTMFVKTWLI